MERGEQAVERLPLLLHPRDSSGARERLDAPHAGGHATLFGDDEQTDIARRPHVSAAAQLHTEARDRHDAHTVAVLLAEERHRTTGDCFVGRLDLGRNRRVAYDLLVDDAL